MADSESQRSGSVAYNARGTSVLATPEQAARARAGKKLARAKRLEASERIAREVLAKMAGEAPAELVTRYAAMQGKPEWFLALAWVIEAQFRQAVSGKAGSTPAARFVAEVAGLIGREDEKDTGSDIPGFQLNLSPEMARSLLDIYRIARENNPELRAKAIALVSKEREQEEDY